MRSPYYRHARRKNRLPGPGRAKQDPRDLDKLLDKGVEDSMLASDPPAVTQPDVHDEPEREPGKSGSDRDNQGY
jgi:hypothetical protein